MKIKRTILAPVLVAATALATGGWFLQRGVGQERNIYANARLFEDVLRYVSDSFVDSKEPTELYKMAIDGMLTELGDPHTSLMVAKDYERLRLQTQGEYGGIGVQIDKRNEWITVIAPLPGTPGSRAGLQAGDQIIEVDGESTKDWSTDIAVSKLRGAPGSTVNIKIARTGSDQPIPIALVREEIHLQAVPSAYMMPGNVGYVELVSFSESSTDELRQAVQKLRTEGAKGIILDLRNNPGGLLDQAIAISDAFLDKGEIVSTRGRHSDDVQRTNARPGDIAEGLPMVVLINGGSASASEIVAGALQDHRRGILLGTRSFGKGSVQTIIPLPGRGAMRLTTARYYTPSGRSIQAKGIEPDITVEPARIEKLEQGELPHEEDLRGALSNDTDGQEEAAPEGQSPEEDEDQSSQNPAGPVTPGATPSTENGEEAPAVPPQVIGDVEQDYQLARAVDLLRGLWLFNARATN